MLSLLRSEFFDGVAQHGARHRGGVLIEESEQDAFGAFASFSQHPTGGFVDQVFGITEQSFAKGERIVEIVVPNEVLGGHDRDAAIPERRGFGQLREWGSGAVDQISPDDVGGGAIDEVPVVDGMFVLQVKLVHGAAMFRSAFGDLQNEDHERDVAMLMDGGVQKRADLGKWQVFV